jgi:hypothetical protein
MYYGTICKYNYADDIDTSIWKGRLAAMVIAVLLSHHCASEADPPHLWGGGGGGACLGLSLPRTPLMWELSALGLPLLYRYYHLAK